MRLFRSSKILILTALIVLQFVSSVNADEHSEYLAERFSYYSLKLRNTSQQAYSTSAYTTCDYVDVCESDLDTIVWTNESDIFPPFQVNTSLVGNKLVGGATVANEINEICFATNLNKVWEAELRDDQYNALAWQYLGFRTEGTYSYFPLSNWSDANACPGTYDPRQRAWYLSAISGPLNVMILIDVSSSEQYNADLRLSKQIESALELLHSLNYWSFFNIGLYTDDVSFFGGSSMLRATAENIARADQFLRETVLNAGRYVALEKVLDSTLSVAGSSDTAGASSSCHTMVVFLSSDHNDISSSTNVETIIDSYDFGDNLMIILSFVFNFESAVADPVYEEMSCLTHGFHRVFTDSSYAASVEQVLTLYSAYLAATLENDNVRYSEIYVDALGLGELTTGAVPLYDTVTDDQGVSIREVVGVYGIDLLVSSLNNGGAINNDDIMASLAAISKCPRLLPTEEILLYFREGSTCDLTSHSTRYGDGGEHTLEQDKVVYDLIGSFGLIGSLLFCLIFLFFCVGGEKDNKFIYAAVIFVLHASFGIALVAYILSTTWDETVINKYWKDSTMTVLSTVIDPSICCDVVNCGCSNYYGSSCSSLVDSYEEGQCSNGYYCCEEEEYDCNCQYNDDGGRDCDTCTRCIRSVNSQQCEVVCEECYTGKAIWSYTPEEISPNVVTKEYSQHCNEGEASASLSCAESFVAKYPVGSQHPIIYNPLDLLETKEGSVDLPGNYYIVIISMAVMLSVSYCILFGAWFSSKESKYKTKEHQAASAAAGMELSGSHPIPQQPVQQIPQQYIQQPQYVQQPQYIQQPQYVSHQQLPPPQQQFSQIPSSAPTNDKYQEEEAPPVSAPPPSYY